MEILLCRCRCRCYAQTNQWASSSDSIRFYDNDKLIYIGSTTQILAVRFGGHKKNQITLYINILKKIIMEISINEDFIIK